MRRRGLEAACVVLLLGVAGVLAVGTGFAKDEDDGAKCSEATLHGRYLVAYDGVDITEKARVPFAAAGYDVFDGNGKVKGVSSGNFNGEVFRNDPFTATYTVKADCTGTSTYSDGAQYDLFIAPDGGMFTFVQINPPEQVASGFELQGTAKRVGD
jgi:hypothetical protein